MRDFRFGVHVLAVSGHDEWVSTARQAEDLGFSTLTVADHLVDGCISPFAALGVAAEATSTLRIGTLVLNNDLRHPAVVARETLALDSLSGGRVELGLGAGTASPSTSQQGFASTMGRRGWHDWPKPSKYSTACFAATTSPSAVTTTS